METAPAARKGTSTVSQVLFQTEIIKRVQTNRRVVGEEEKIFTLLGAHLKEGTRRMWGRWRGKAHSYSMAEVFRKH